MASKEDGSPIWPTLAMMVGILLIAFTFLYFVTLGGSGVTVNSFNGFTISGLGGFEAKGLGGFNGSLGFNLAFLIPVGGIIGLLFGGLAFIPSMKLRARILGVLILLGGILALDGSVITFLQLNSFATQYIFAAYYSPIPTLQPASPGIGLSGSLILGFVEIIVAIPVILRK